MKASSELIVQEVSPYLRDSTVIWVAYSGGVDSTVLLKLATEAKLSVPIKAIHINHQLSPNANQWAVHCADFAKSLGVDCIVETVTVENHGKGIEEGARQQRYNVFEKHVKRNDILLTAHNLGDQAETLLFRLFRGTGLRGLRGIQQQRRMGEGRVVRPLLEVAKANIQEYAIAKQLKWIEDESNRDLQFDRNFIRHNIMPILKERWAHAEEKIEVATHWINEADALLHEYVNEDLKRCDLIEERVGESVALSVFLHYSFSRQKHIIRYWCERNSFLFPEILQLEKLKEVVFAREDAKPLLCWGDYQLRRFRQRLYLMSKLPDFDAVKLKWNGLEPLSLPDGSKLSMKRDDAKALDISVTFRQGGERCRPESREHSQTLKKLFQEYNLEPWLRDRAPILMIDGEIAAVAGVFVCHGYGKVLTGLRWSYEDSMRF